MIKKFKENIFSNSFYLLFTVALLKMLYSQIAEGFGKESWQITEWLINYEGGFVRRGFSGEVILKFYTHFGIAPYALIVSFCLICYLVLIAFFVYYFIKKGYPLFILPLVFFLGEPVINNYWVRKDVFIILIIISILYCLRKKSLLYLALINLLFIVSILIHEAIGFLGMPIVLLLLVNKEKVIQSGNSFIRPFIISITKLIPAIVAFLVCLYYKGTPSIAAEIWKSWVPIKFPISTNDIYAIPASIDGIAWTLQYGLTYSKAVFKNFADDMYAPIVWAASYLLVYYFLTNINKLNARVSKLKQYQQFNNQNISNVLVFQLLIMIPLFILGWDYGRWAFLWVSSSFAIFILVPEGQLSELFPKFITAISVRLNALLNAIFVKPQYVIYIIPLVLGLSACSRDFTIGYLSTPIIITLKFITSGIHSLFVSVGSL
jgi:hypothetical protein